MFVCLVCFWFGFKTTSPYLALASLEPSVEQTGLGFVSILHLLNAGIRSMRHHRNLQMLAADSSSSSLLLLPPLKIVVPSAGLELLCRSYRARTHRNLLSSAWITGIYHHAQHQRIFCKACSLCASEVVKAVRRIKPPGASSKYTTVALANMLSADFLRFQSVFPNTDALNLAV